MTANPHLHIVGQHRTSDRGEWQDLHFPVQEPYPRIRPGEYYARSVKLERFFLFNRFNLVIWFDVYNADPTTGGNVIAQVPGFFPLPGTRNNPRKPLSPSSKLARMVMLTGNDRLLRSGVIPARVLRQKLWKVEIGDARKSSLHRANGEHRDLHETQVYSRVEHVKEHIA